MHILITLVGIYQTKPQINKTYTPLDSPVQWEKEIILCMAHELCTMRGG